MRATLAWLFVALVASSVPARASPDCMSLAEARAAHPGKHLYWHRRGKDRCWDDTGPSRRYSVGARGRAAERPQIESPVPSPLPPAAPQRKRNERLLFPTLVQGAGPDDPQLLVGAPMQAWPLLLDIDAVTASAPPPDADECCWPPLEPPFRERWADMPATWFFSALRLEIKP